MKKPTLKTTPKNASKKFVCVRIDAADHAQLLQVAKANHRTMSGEIKARIQAAMVA